MKPPAARWVPVTLILGMLALFSLAYFRTAWVSEDAFITFRVIDNALNGHGLTWNPGERVQAYTHPAWLGLLLPLVAVVGDPYFATLGLSYGLMIFALSLAAIALARGRPAALAALMCLLWSRAFVDYSSSGLENPLLYALLAVYTWIWVGLTAHRWRTAMLLGIASLTFLTRPDAIVLLLPSLIAHVWSFRGALRPQIAQFACGSLPALIWTGFSLVYYGTPVPNTAIAKVATGIGLQQRFTQALHYVEWSATNDGMTLAIIAGGFVLGIVGARGALRPLALGLPAWLVYVFYVGGDYMGGRFFSFPVFMAAALASAALAVRPNKALLAALGALLAWNHQALDSTVFSSAQFRYGYIAETGIADERGFYYQDLGLVPVLARGTWASHPWLVEGRKLRGMRGVLSRCTIGMVAYAAGPDVYWIDPLALAEPFLARLPARTNPRVGHYERAFPAGFVESRLSARNAITDPDLRALFDDVDLATRAPMTSIPRLHAIWRLNAGYHAKASTIHDRDAVGLPGIPARTHASLSCFGLHPWEDGTWAFDASPLRARRVAVGVS